MSSIVCPSCGIKVRAGRSRCPRCREPLASPATPVAAAQQTTGEPAPSWFVPGVIGVVIVVGGLAGFAFWQRSGTIAKNAPSAPSVAVAPDHPVSPHPALAPGVPPEALSPDRFIEPAQGGTLAYGRGDYDKAAALFEEAVAKHPQDAEAWSNLGQVLVRQNRVEESLDKFRRAIELNPNRWTYHFNLARAQGLLKKWDAAVDGYRQAQRLYPDDYATAFNLGLALRQAGDDGAAVDAFKRAIELDPQDPTFHLSLASAYEKLGQVADAITEYQRTLELAGPAPEAPAIQARITRLKAGASAPPTAPAAPPPKEAAPSSDSGR